MNVKITKQSHAFEGYVILYYAEILSSFNPELQLKDDKSATKNKPIDLLPKLKSFKFVTKVVLEFKKIQSNDRTLYSTFNLNLEAQATIKKSDIK